MADGHTFHVNRSKLLIAALEARGWTAAPEEAPADLAFWDRYKAPARAGRLQVLEPKDANQIDGKRSLFRTLRDAGHADYMPETWLSLKAWERDAPEGTPWYVKASHLSGGRGIHCVSDRNGIAAALKDIPGQAVIQRSVPDPLLLDARKFTVRTYVLWLGSGAHRIYRESLLILQPQPWDDADLDPEVQFLHRKPLYLSSSDWDAYPAFFDRIAEMSRRTLAAYDAKLGGAGDVSRFQLTGFDYLCDVDGRPWLIEINAWPNFGWRERVTQRAIKQRLMADFARGVEGMLDGAEPDWTGFDRL